MEYEDRRMLKDLEWALKYGLEVGLIVTVLTRMVSWLAGLGIKRSSCGIRRQENA